MIGLSVPVRRLEPWPTRRHTVRSRVRSRSIRACTGSATGTVGSSTSARHARSAAGCRRTSKTSRRCTRAPARWSPPARASSGPWCATRSRRCSWSTPGSRSSTRASTSGTATTSRIRTLAVTLYEDYPRAAGHAGAEEAQGRALLRPVRPRLGDPRDARPAAACLSGPDVLATACSSALARSGRPCLLGYIEQVQRLPASDGSAEDEHRDIVDRLLRLHGRCAPISFHETARNGR